MPSHATNIQRIKTDMPPSDAKDNLQDTFLTHLLKHKAPTTVFLTNGVKLQGVVAGFDHVSLLLRRESHAQLIYKHAISTIMPNTPIRVGEAVDDEPETNPA